MTSAIYKVATRFLDLIPMFIRERLLWLLQSSLGMRCIEDLSEEIRLVTCLLSDSEDPVAIDIGANLGTWSLGLLDRLSEAKVVCFEPNPNIVQERLREDPRAEVIHMAVSNGHGVRTLFLVDEEAGGSGMASLHDRNLGGNSPIDVQVLPLDNIKEISRLANIDYIKIDVEGHEMFVLEGGTNLIADRRPIVQFEYGGAWIDSRRYLREAFKYFENLSYSLFRINRGKLLGPLSYSEDIENYRFANYVAISGEKSAIASKLRF